MREARYAAAGAGTKGAKSAAARSATEPVTAPAAPRKRPAGAKKVGAATPEPTETPEQIGAPAAPAAEEPVEALCGHRSMNGRNCRRPAGHAEKNHRYS